MSSEAPAPALDVGAVASAFVEALCSRDWASLEAHVGADATWVAPGATTAQGRAALLDALASTPGSLELAGPLRVTRGTEVAWPSHERTLAGGESPDVSLVGTAPKPRVDVLELDAQGRVCRWTTLRDEPGDGQGATHAARRVALEQYVERVGRADSAAVLTLFAAECDVEDPVGTPVHHGRAAVEAFYGSGLTAITSTQRLGPPVVSGHVGAIPFRVELQVGDRALALEVIDVMTFDDANLFTSMRAFWGRSNRHAR